MSCITNFFSVIWMKKDTHSVFICTTPNWNFPLKNTDSTSSAARRKPPHVGGTTGEKTIPNHYPTSWAWNLFLRSNLEPHLKLKRGQKNYWSSSYICICMSCSPRFHPDIIILHTEKPAPIETRASALGKLAVLVGWEIILSWSESSVTLGVFCKSCQRWQGERKDPAPQRRGESKLSCRNNIDWQRQRRCWEDRLGQRTQNLGQNRLPMPI